MPEYQSCLIRLNTFSMTEIDVCCLFVLRTLQFWEITNHLATHTHRIETFLERQLPEFHKLAIMNGSRKVQAVLANDRGRTCRHKPYLVTQQPSLTWNPLIIWICPNAWVGSRYLHTVVCFSELPHAHMRGIGTRAPHQPLESKLPRNRQDHSCTKDTNQTGK